MSGRPTDGNNRRRRHQSDKVLAACGFHLWNAARDITRKLKLSASPISRTEHFFANLNNKKFATAGSVPFDERSHKSLPTHTDLDMGPKYVYRLQYSDLYLNPRIIFISFNLWKVWLRYTFSSQQEESDLKQKIFALNESFHFKNIP